MSYCFSVGIAMREEDRKEFISYLEQYEDTDNYKYYFTDEFNDENDEITCQIKKYGNSDESQIVTKYIPEVGWWLDINDVFWRFMRTCEYPYKTATISECYQVSERGYYGEEGQWKEKYKNIFDELIYAKAKLR